MFCMRCVGGLPYGFLIRSDTKQAVQTQEIDIIFFLKKIFLDIKVYLVTLENKYIKT